MLEKEGLAKEVCRYLNLKNAVTRNEQWIEMIDKRNKILMIGLLSTALSMNMVG